MTPAILFEPLFAYPCTSLFWVMRQNNKYQHHVFLQPPKKMFIIIVVKCPHRFFCITAIPPDRFGDSWCLRAEEAMAFYQLLGVTREASFEEIKVAFKRRALQVHPDKGPEVHWMLVIWIGWGGLKEGVNTLLGLKKVGNIWNANRSFSAGLW